MVYKKKLLVRVQEKKQSQNWFSFILRKLTWILVYRLRFLSHEAINGLITTVGYQVILINAFLSQDYSYVLTRQLQNSPLENRF